MVASSLYIIGCTAKNRTRRWLTRLREPRYAIGAVVGAAYLWFAVVARFWAAGARASARRPPPFVEEWPALTTFGASWIGMIILVISALAWVLPATGALLTFTQPEEQFLFPAPLSRRQLLIHRMIRSQLGILFGSLISALALPNGAPATRLRTALSVWLLFFTSRVYLSGVTLAKARLWAPDARSRLLSRLPLAFVLVTTIAIGVGFARSVMARPLTSLADILTRFDPTQLTTGTRSLFMPFVALGRMFLARDWTAFLPWLGASLVILTTSIAWVLLNDTAFQDIATETAEQRQNRPQPGRGVAYRARQAGWNLAPSGRPEAAFAWKGALQTFRVIDRRIVIRLIAILLWIAILMRAVGQSRGVSAAGAVFAIAGAFLATLLGPLAIRVDLRQDLQHLELLRTWPVRAAAVVRGEMLWPAMMLSSIAWTLILVAVIVSQPLFPDSTVAMRLSLGLAALLIAPAMIAAQLTIHNIAALLLPAWFASGSQRGRGVDAIGHRLILVTGTVLALTLAMAPGAILGGIVWFALRHLIGAASIALAAVVVTVVTLFEVLMATEMMGPAYEKLDLLAVERVE